MMLTVDMPAKRVRGRIVSLGNRHTQHDVRASGEVILSTLTEPMSCDAQGEDEGDNHDACPMGNQLQPR